MSETRDPRDGRTPEDIRNGWSFEDWLAYHQERVKAADPRIDPHHPSRRVRPKTTLGFAFGPGARSWTVGTRSFGPWSRRDQRR